MRENINTINYSLSLICYNNKYLEIRERDKTHQILFLPHQVPDHLEPGLNDRQLTRLLGLDLQTSPSPITPPAPVSQTQAPPPSLSTNSKPRRRGNIADLTEQESQSMLKEQMASNKYSSLVSHNLILKQGNVDKRKVRIHYFYY